MSTDHETTHGAPAPSTPGAGEEPHRFHTIIEPFRIKTIERIAMTTPVDRRQRLEAVGFNVFRLHAPAGARVADTGRRE